MQERGRKLVEAGEAGFEEDSASCGPEGEDVRMAEDADPVLLGSFLLPPLPPLAHDKSSDCL